jgi:DNA-directed RNA polymerase subunit RPC12/RpoP
MIHFRCVQCDKALKVPEGKAGATVLCPRCQERLVVPSGASASGIDEPTDSPGHTPELEGTDQPVNSFWDQAGELFAGMSPGLRLVEVLLAGLGLITLLLALLALFVPLPGGFAAAVISSAMFLVPLFVVVFLVILYGHATSCPLCGRWWVRAKYATEFVGREVFERNGDSFARSTYKTTYICNACKHKWSANYSEEFKESMSDRLKRPVRESRRRRIDQE